VTAGAVQPYLSILYRQSILILWLAWAAYWVLSAARTKSTQRRESRASRLSHVLPLLIGVALIAWPRLSLPALPWLSWPLPYPQGRFLIGVLLVAAGLGYTFWARVHLGANWSGTVTQKEHHELIRTGPYAYVRHPIYTGLLIALVGSAVVRGEPRALLGLAIIAYALVRKLRIEERFMHELFPREYARYRAEVPALVPLTRAPRSAPR
jgi:protein-S-isoprenylcysteine O-methyltransferase Ste14